jgi:phosphohistidine phosphatase
MRSLTLFRHAKTERDSATGKDFDRRLSSQGLHDAPLVGKEMRDLGLTYDLVLCSPAARAAETAELAGLSPRFDQRIYEATAEELLAIVQHIDETAERVAMIGHNPGFEQLASLMLGQGVSMPTGSLIDISLPIDQWSDAGANGRLSRFIQPKELA